MQNVGASDAVPACTVASHEALKLDPAAFRAATAPGGFQEDGVELLELRRCLSCGSTLSIPAPRPTVRESARSFRVWFAGQIADMVAKGELTLERSRQLFPGWESFATARQS